MSTSARESGGRAASTTAGLIGLAVGVPLSGFGPQVPVVAAAICFVVAAVSSRARPIAGALGLGLCFGLLTYVLLGVIQDPGSPSGSGTGHAG